MQTGQPCAQTLPRHPPKERGGHALPHNHEDTEYAPGRPNPTPHHDTAQVSGLRAAGRDHPTVHARRSADGGRARKGGMRSRSLVHSPDRRARPVRTPERARTASSYRPPEMSGISPDAIPASSSASPRPTNQRSPFVGEWARPRESPRQGASKGRRTSGVRSRAAGSYGARMGPHEPYPYRHPYQYRRRIPPAPLRSSRTPLWV